MITLKVSVAISSMLSDISSRKVLSHPSNIPIGKNPIGINIFEWAFDLSSFNKLNPFANYHAIVLNGLANLTTQLMEDIDQRSSNLSVSVQLYLDNEKAGNEKTSLVKEVIKNAEDRRGLYWKL